MHEVVPPPIMPRMKIELHNGWRESSGEVVWFGFAVHTMKCCDNCCPRGSKTFVEGVLLNFGFTITFHHGKIQ